MGESVLLIQSDSNRHLGLFRDLEHDNHVDILTYPNHISNARKVLTRLSEDASFSLAAKEQGIRLFYDRIVVIDTALGRMSEKTVKRLRRRTKDIRVLLLNSFGAASPSFEPVRKRIDWFDSSEVYTFDPLEAKAMGFNFYGLQYYSRADMPESGAILYDCYFVGGIKGGRGELIRSLYKSMRESCVDALFECTFMKGEHETTDDSGIKWLHASWQPYKNVLANDLASACVVEILQEGQHAQSLRYFEAICYNRKLLTNNTHVVDLPFYDDRYIRVFHDANDVDMDWLKGRELPEYGYSNEFSPSCSKLFGA